MKEIIEYEKIVQKIAKKFVKKYFSEEEEYWDYECFWIGDEIGGVLTVSDYYFNFDNILDYLKNNYTVEELFDYYDYYLDEAIKNKTPINIKNWLKLK